MHDHEQWLQKAFSDLSSSKKLLQHDDETLDTAAYHTQQCAEKSLKAYLTFKQHNAPRTHDLGKLLELCVQYDSSFTSLLNDALDLIPYAVYSRYPDDRFNIDRQEVLAALEKSSRILNFVKKKCAPSHSNNQTIF